MRNVRLAHIALAHEKQPVEQAWRVLLCTQERGHGGRHEQALPAPWVREAAVFQCSRQQVWQVLLCAQERGHGGRQE